MLIGSGTTAFTQDTGLTYASSTLTAGNVNVPNGGKYKIDGTDLALSDIAGTLSISKGGSQWTSGASGTGIIYYSSGKVGINATTTPSALLHLVGDATNTGTLRLDYITTTTGIGPNFELVRATDIASANYNWNILNDNSFKLQSKNLATAYTTTFEIAGNGNIGINTGPHATYKLDVNGTLNATSLYVGGTAFTGSSQWVGTTNIYNITGNVGVGTSTTPINLLELTKSTYTGALLSLDVGIANDATGAMSRSIGKPLIKLGRNFYSSTVGDYYGMGFGYAPIALSNSCCEIGVLITSITGNETGDIVLSTRAGTTDIPATERMRITSVGNVGIGIASPLATLHIAGTGVNNNIGNIIATGDITAYYSDERLKTKISTINNPLSIVNKLHGFYYLPNEIATKYGINNNKVEIGLSAQDVQKVLPELVKLAPFDMKMNEAGEIISKSGEKYLTISYERLVPVLVEAIKELNQKNISFTNENNTTIKIDEHRAIINSLEERIKDLETKITRILNYINI